MTIAEFFHQTNWEELRRQKDALSRARASVRHEDGILFTDLLGFLDRLQMADSGPVHPPVLADRDNHTDIWKVKR